MKGLISVLLAALISVQLSAEAYKDELKSIASDRKMITVMEKTVADDEKGCGTVDQSLNAAVQIEINIYCQARMRAISRLPELKKLIDEYEPVLKNFFDNCPEVTDDEKLKLCQTLHEKVTEKAASINKEKEELQKDIDLMENAGKKAAETFKHNKDVEQKERGQYLKDALRLKKDTVQTMNSGLLEDMLVFNRSKSALTKNLTRGSKELQEKTAYLLKGVTKIIGINADLQNICSGMLRSIDAANNACNLKYSEAGCNDAEKTLEKKFEDGNSAIKAYTSDKITLASVETALNKKAVEEAALMMEKATAQITGYLKNIEMQNDMLKQRIELSKNDAEVLRGMENKTFLKTYMGLVETMISLKVETDGFIKKFNYYLERMTKFRSECTDSKTELTALCHETGTALTSEVDATVDKLTPYGARFNRLNSDLASFSRKVSGK